MGHTQARSVFPTAFGSLSASDFRALILRRSTLSSLIAFSILHASESRGIPEPPGLPPQTLEIRMHFSRVQYLTRIAFYIRISIDFLFCLEHHAVIQSVFVSFNYK